MNRSTRVGFALVSGALVAALVAFWSASLPGQLFINAGMIELTKAIDCPENRFTCRVHPFTLRSPDTDAQQHYLDRAARWLMSDVLGRAPLPFARVHQATLQFVQGDRMAAATTLATAPPFPLGRSPLLAENRYESFLVRARANMQAHEWQAAVDDFRQATILDPNAMLAVDDADWYRSLAQIEIQTAEREPDNSRSLYLAGKYLALAGEENDAIRWLETARSSQSAQALSAQERAWADVYLAQTLRKIGKLTEARAVLDAAVARTPNSRPALFQLLEVAREMGDELTAQQAESALSSLGPTYRLGQHAGEFSADAPAHLGNGWTLVGYDVDEQLLEQTSAVELLLWWQAPMETLSYPQQTRVGKYWLQRQTVRNLFANAGFEWGTDERGMPMGHAREYYNAPADSLTITATDLNGETTRVLAAQNSEKAEKVALLGFPVAVDSTGQYLMAAWQQDEDRLSRTGRLCVERRFGPEIGYYIFADRRRPTQAWVHVADLGPASPDHTPRSCAAFLLNSNSRHTALWDRVLFARVETP